jgi:hypothetical protein
MKRTTTCVCAVLFALLSWCAGAQDASSTLGGSVIDETGQVLPGASVTLVQEHTRAARAAVTDGRGEFRFPALTPGTYTVKVELSGFRPYEKRSIVLNASAMLSVGAVKLAVGFGETVVVEDEGTKVNPEDSQHSGLLTATQIEQIQIKGRDVMSLLRLVPGVRYEDDIEAMGESFGSQVPQVGGQRRHWNQITVDGLNGNELSGTNRFASAINLDAVSEVKILLNTYRAEFGRTGGANIQISSKGGGSGYKGSAYWYARRTAWNANSWANNKSNVPRGQYHYDTPGFNLGGPVRVPGLFEPREKKLFFFYSVEAPQTQKPGALHKYRMPTAREIEGDFSQTFDNAGKLILIKDPLLASLGVPCTDSDRSGCFPGNRIPASRIDASEQSLLRQLPTPDHLDFDETKNNWNFQRQESPENPRWNHVLRLDYKPSRRDSLFFSVRTFDSLQRGSEITAGPAKWGFYDGTYDFSDDGASFGHTHIFGSHVVNEFSAGGRRQTEGFGWATDADRARTRRADVGWSVGQFHPELNPLDIMPVARFGLNTSGVDAVEFNFPDRLGDTVADWLFTARDNITFTRHRHAYKAGFYVDYIRNNEARGGTWMGNYNFARNTSNPLDANFAYANALLGVFQTYEEQDAYRSTQNRAWMAEGYLQDTWKVGRRMTVDYGVRFLWYTPYWQANGRTAAFSLERYDPAKAPRIYRPARIDGKNYAQDPRTGELKNEIYVGTYVPGSGDPANGMVRGDDPTYPKGFRDNQGIHPEPRVGFAWDLLGNAKTVLHTSAGLFHQARLGGGSQGNLQGPPFITRGIVYYGTTGSLLGGPPLSSRPSDINGIERDAKTPSVYKLSFGLQREIVKGVVADVSYVGSVNRHLEMSNNINAVRDGMRFYDVHPENKDPRRSGALPDEFLRTYPGWQDITIRENWGTSNYNALQMQVNRRYSKGVQFGVAYTYSRALGIADDDPGSYDFQRPLREWHYAPADYNQAHSFVVSYTWDLPKASRLVRSGAVKVLFDGWQLSGENAWVQGTWDSVTLSTTDGYDFDGGDSSARPVMLGNPLLQAGQRRDTFWFNTSMFARPAGRGDYGNTPRNVIKLPGTSNWNLSAFKNFSFKKKRLQLRVEGYNVLNHTQYRDVDTTARFDVSGAQVNGSFGRVTAARGARVVQTSVRLSF